MHRLVSAQPCADVRVDRPALVASRARTFDAKPPWMLSAIREPALVVEAIAERSGSPEPFARSDVSETTAALDSAFA